MPQTVVEWSVVVVAAALAVCVAFLIPAAVESRRDARRLERLAARAEGEVGTLLRRVTDTLESVREAAFRVGRMAQRAEQYIERTQDAVAPPVAGVLGVVEGVRQAVGVLLGRSPQSTDADERRQGADRP